MTAFATRSATLTHRLPHGLAFLFVELAVIVFVEFFDHPLAELGATRRRAPFATLFRRLGQRGPCQQAGRDNNESDGQVSHVRPPPTFVCVENRAC
jgi:hypothetical protein